MNCVGFLAKRTLIVLMLVSMSTACLAGCGVSFLPEPSDSKVISAETLKALYTGTVESLDAEERALYDSTIGVLLEEDLWTERDMYDACHYLMIPMYYAFYAGDEAYISHFAELFSRFVEDVNGPDAYSFREGGILNKLHFFYLCTQFMNLCQVNGYDELIPVSLPRMAQDFAADYLLNHKANWGVEPTVIQRMENSLAGKQYKQHWHRAFEDLDRFTLAILCDLKCFHVLRGEAYDGVLDTAADLAYRFLSSPAYNQETEDGGWLFQPGIWSDHPDYAYAGNETITEDIQPKSREDLTEDSSHSHRLPLYLRSWQSAQPNETCWELFTLRREQLANQLANHVLRKVDGAWLCTTFMDGTNGVYRYEYHEEGVGLAGYDLSGTFLLGWWSLLGDSRITRVYQDILEQYPMKGNRSNPYFDHATVREQNPYFDMDTAFDNGMFQCMTTCAATLRPA